MTRIGLVFVCVGRQCILLDMAIDHFTKHKEQIGRTDWNFNFLFDDQPQVAELAARYAPLLKHPGLHKPVPGQWLHATLLRVGFVEDFTEAEMLAVADKLEQKLTHTKMPQLILGRRWWWLWNGGPVLGFTPSKQLLQVYGYVLESLIEVVGRDRVPAPSIPSGGRLKTMLGYPPTLFSKIVGRDRLPRRLQFIPHVTLAYPKTYDDERSLYKQLKAQSVDGVQVRITSVSLIKQRIVDDYYAWEVVRELPIAQK